VRYPTGHYIRQLEGPVGNMEVESEALLIQHNISYAPFTPQVRSCLPQRWTITQHDIEQRVDLRHLRIFSIDPPGIITFDFLRRITTCRSIEIVLLIIGNSFSRMQRHRRRVAYSITT
jgi:exosome complex exonuclease DIS3/RRP44